MSTATSSHGCTHGNRRLKNKDTGEKVQGADTWPVHTSVTMDKVTWTEHSHEKSRKTRTESCKRPVTVEQKRNRS